VPGKLEARVSQHDREIAAIRKLILTGMKMIAGMQSVQREMQATQREIQRDLKALAASQRETAQELKALIRSLRGGTNGHGKLTEKL
jgi:signal transduction histidine kinase